MRCAGIDIGSRTIEWVTVEDGRIAETRLMESGPDPRAAAIELIRGACFDRLMATGYGRHLLEIEHDVPTVTEIKAYARGARAVLPDCRTILDIGGQDVKAMALAEDGRVRKFEMNDRCAAGSGRFLEVMAQTLGCPIADFGPLAMLGRHTVSISSMCTVFAESEVTSLLHNGTLRPDVALAVHGSIVTRVVGMLRRVSVAEPLLFAGGGALNTCLRTLLEDSLHMNVHVPEQPQMLGAYGAALLVKE